MANLIEHTERAKTITLPPPTVPTVGKAGPAAASSGANPSSTPGSHGSGQGHGPK